MAAPTPAATPHAPAGVRIENGLPTIITLAIDSDIAFWEVDVTPPGIDGGDANDLTNMHNIDWRQYAARTLKTLTEASSTVQIAPESFTQILAVVNVETTVTVHMPGGAKLAFYGYVRVWAPAAFVEGEPPTGTITIQPTNRDPADDTEQGPVLVLPVGMARRKGLSALRQIAAKDDGAGTMHAKPAAERVKRKGKAKTTEKHEPATSA
jgi:hypothetical protein